MSPALFFGTEAKKKHILSQDLVAVLLSFKKGAVIITALFAWAYERYGQLPGVESFIFGIKPAIIALIVSLMISIGKKALKSVELGVLGVIAAVLALYGIHEIYILFGAGLVGILIHLLKAPKLKITHFLSFCVVTNKIVFKNFDRWFVING